MVERPQLVGRPDPHNVYLLDHGALPMVEKMMQTGIRVDTGKLEQLGRDIDRQMEELGVTIWKLAGREFNIASDEQLAQLLFTRRSEGGLGVDPKYIKKTKKTRRPSVKKDELEKVVGDHPVIRPVVEWKHLEHLQSSFIGKLRKAVGEDGRVRAQVLATRVESGRLAMKNPPLMQIPVRTEIGRKIRGCFIAADGCKLWSVDQSQIEMRVAAHVSNALKMIACFLDRDDMHWRTAESIYKKPREILSKGEHRDNCKSVGFGILFCIMALGLRNQILARGGDPEFWTLTRCEELIEMWYGEYPEIKERQEKQFYRARRYEMVWCPFGRVRMIPEVKSVHGYTVGEGLRAAANHEIQAGAQGLMKLAMRPDAVFGFCEEIEKKGKVCRVLLQIHDELLGESSEDIAEEVVEIVRGEMERVAELRVPIESSGKVGDTWAELK